MKMFAIVGLGLAALLSACSPTTPAVPAASPTPVATAPALEGTSWTVSKIKDAATLAGHEPTMRFDAETVAGLASCNRFTGSYTQDGAGLTFGALATTAMMCGEDPVMAQEQLFLTTVATVTTVREAGTGLELLDAAQKVALTLVPVQDKPLTGTTWKLSGIISNEAVTSPTSGGSVTMRIDAGELSGKACNAFSGPVTAGEDGSFQAGPLRSTKMACASEALDTEETAVLTTLEKATSYSIEESTLTLKAPDGTGLEFVAA
ncbi:MAG: META domain-containing protein [Propionicimonas sp.]